MTRVWLSRWEWACCGDPFEIGDEIEYGIRTRDPASLAEVLGPELAVTVAAWESHHEQEYADRIVGRVVAAYEVTSEVIEREFEHSVDLGERPGAAGPQAAGEIARRRRISRVMTRIESIPGTSKLEAVRRVPSAEGEGVAAEPAPTAEQEIPEERRRRVRSGWLVDVDETRTP